MNENIQNQNELNQNVKPNNASNNSIANNMGNYYSQQNNNLYQTSYLEYYEKRRKNDVIEFRIFGLPTILYALFFVFCLYKNFSGITSPFWNLFTVGYIAYIAKKLSKEWTIINTFLSTIIILLGISNFTTGNSTIIFLNYFVIFSLIIINVMYLFFDLKKINVSQHLLLIAKLLIGILVEIITPFRQPIIFLKSNTIKKSEKMLHIIIGIIFAIPIFFFMLWILSSADEVFHEVFIQIGEMLSFDSLFANLIFIIIMLIIGYMVPYAFLKNIYSGNDQVNDKDTRTREPIIALIISIFISVLYVLFSAIQIIYLFMGKGSLPAGYSYAEYAREGFFQLLFVSVFNAVMVLVCIEFIKNSKALKTVLSIICGCTFVMIASSAYRMAMYISQYGLTFTRIFVLWALAVIALVMIGIVIQMYSLKFNLFRYMLISVSVCFVMLSFGHIDYFIAKYDMNMYAETLKQLSSDELYENQYVDYDYLLRLSTDAAPIMAEHIDIFEKYINENEYHTDASEFCIYNDEYDYNYSYYSETKHLDNHTWFYYYRNPKRQLSIRKFNLSRFFAQQTLRGK